VFAVHDYAVPGIADGGVYPGTTRGEWFDRDVVERTFLRRTEFMTRTGTPVWIGEFGPLYTGDPAADAQRYALLWDQLEIYDAHRAGWSLWTYKDLGLQGLVTVPPDSPYARRIADVLAKKKRLGTDAWGGTDRRIRHVLAPLEDLVAAEFPDFNPYPGGSASGSPGWSGRSCSPSPSSRSSPPASPGWVRRRRKGSRNRSRSRTATATTRSPPW
jgi:hypothetical protein